MAGHCRCAGARHNLNGTDLCMGHALGALAIRSETIQITTKIGPWGRSGSTWRGCAGGRDS
eukprot:2821633-Pyramimonas_sp.AAC.1